MGSRVCRAGMALVFMCLVCAAPRVWGANAVWSEEMTALPDPSRWGQYDDADGLLADMIELVSDPDNASNTGVWRIPQDSASTGMAAISAPGVADPPGKNFLQYTFEARYRIVSTFDDITNEQIVFPDGGAFGHFEAYPLAIDVSNGNAPGLRFKDGYRSLDGVTNDEGYTYFEVQNNEGLGGGQFFHPTQSEVAPTARDEWHVLRMVADFTPDPQGGFQRVYLDGELIRENDLSPAVIENPIYFARSLYLRQDGQGDPSREDGREGPAPYTLDQYRFQEVLLDYFRMVDRVIEITEPLNAAASLACDLNGDGAADAADAGMMFGNWGRSGVGDCSNDNTVDAADAGILFSEWTGDPTASEGSAAAEYHVGTGEIKVHANNVVNWYIQSTSNGLTGAAVGDLPGPGLVTDNNSRVGETALGKFAYEANLGNVAAAGLPQGDLTIYWNSDLGRPLQSAPVQYVPEPAGCVLVGATLLGFAFRRRD